MSSNIESKTPEPLDEAIRLLYKGRPAKVAMLLGLVPSTMSEELTKLSFSTGPIVSREQRTPPASKFNPIKDLDGKVGIAGGIKNVDGDANRELKAPNFKVTGPEVSTKAPASLLSDNERRGKTVTSSFLGKTAMTEHELMAMYNPGMVMEEDKISPQTLLGIGAGGAGVVGANRLKTTSMAKRELKNLRKAYLKATQEGSLTRSHLQDLNRELQLRGANTKLTRAPTTGIADAQMQRAEQQLAKRLTKKRYRGAMPLVVASLLGTLAYNKLSDER